MTFRTITNLLDYNDNEQGFPPSLTDETQYEPLQVTIKRFERSGRLPPYDMSDYDDGDPDELLDKENPFDSPNLDLADVSALEARAQYEQSVLHTQKLNVKMDKKRGNIHRKRRD